jgi:hypothetical protein
MTCTMCGDFCASTAAATVPAHTAIFANASPATAQPPKWLRMAKIGALDGCTHRRGPRILDTTQRARAIRTALLSSCATTQTRRAAWPLCDERLELHASPAT